MAWYRGPVTPHLIAPMDPPLRFVTADAALIYDSAHGIFDVSLVSAWQLGRAAALADRSFGQALFTYRQRVQQAGDMLVDRLRRDHFPAGPLAELGGVRLTRAAMEAVAWMLGADAEPARSASGRSSRPPRPARALTGTALADALAEPSVRAAVAAITADALDPVADWLAALTLLEPLPFSCLVPDERMLPRASLAPDGATTLLGAIRFGYLDPNWIAALVDGATSLAIESSAQLAAATTLHESLRAAVATATAKRCGQADVQTGPTTALLLRSDLVSGWPTLSVTPLGRDGVSQLPVLRMDRLAPGVLLALFDGVPAHVRIAEPHATVTLGVSEDGAAELRNLTPPKTSAAPQIGEPLSRSVPVLASTCLRPGSRTLALTSPDGLVATLSSALAAPASRLTWTGRRPWHCNCSMLRNP